MTIKVQGHYPAMNNGEMSYVIVEFKVKTLEEAQKEVLKRQSSYKNLIIIEEQT